MILLNLHRFSWLSFPRDQQHTFSWLGMSAHATEEYCHRNINDLEKTTPPNPDPLMKALIESSKLLKKPILKQDPRPPRSFCSSIRNLPSNYAHWAPIGSMFDLMFVVFPLPIGWRVYFLSLADRRPLCFLTRKWPSSLCARQVLLDKTDHSHNLSWTCENQE